jgi:WD40 repeat protein
VISKGISPLDTVGDAGQNARAWFGRREDFDYDVFISYRSVDGRRVAEWLSKGLRNYRAPKAFSKTIPAIRVYRDTELERVTPAIWQERIRPALVRSRFLLLVLTPSVLEPLESGQPNWVMREVREFLELPQSGNFLLTRARGHDAMPSLPEVDARFPEPGWVDIRSAANWTRILKRAELGDKLTALAVPALGIDDKDIPKFNRLAEREKRRIAWLTAAVSVALLFLVSALAIVAILQRGKAIRSLAEARASEFAARSRSNAQTRPDIAIALALHSLSSMSNYGILSTDGEQALRGALAQTQGQHFFCQPELEGMYPDEAASFDISPDQSLIAIGTTSGSLCIYQNRGNDGPKLIEVLQSFGTETITATRFSPDGRWLFTQTATGYLRGLNLEDSVLNEKKRKFSENNDAFEDFGKNDQVGEAAFDSTGSKIAFYSPVSKCIEMWGLTDFNPAGHALKSFAVAGDVVAVGLSPNGHFVAALVRKSHNEKSFSSKFPSQDPSNYRFLVRIWSTISEQQTTIEKVLSRVEWELDDNYSRTSARGLVRITDNSDWFAAALKLEDTHNPQRQLAAEVWRISGGRPIRTQQYTGACNGSYGCDGENKNGWSRIADIDFSPNGKWLYVVHNTSIRLWSLARNASATLAPPGVQQGRSNSLGVIYAASVSPDGEYLATGDTNGSLTVWQLPMDGTPPDAVLFQAFPRDPLIRSAGLVRFSRHSTFVGMGAQQGSLELCRVADRCGSIEPSRVVAPRQEGQWISWSSGADGGWTSAVSEARRIHYFRGDDFGKPFYSADVLTNDAKIPVTTKEYIIVSGRTGRQIASLISPDGKWAVGFEVGQYGANRNLILVKLAGRPAQVRLGRAELGCESFTGVTFDPRGRMLLTWCNNTQASGSRASLIELPPIDGDVAAPVKIRTLDGFEGGNLEFTRGGEFILSDNSAEESVRIWRRDKGGFVPIVLEKDKKMTHMIADPLARFVVIQEDAGKSHYLGIAGLKNGEEIGIRQIASFDTQPLVAFGPKGNWLILAVKEAKDVLVQLRRTSDVSKLAAEWRTRIDGSTLQIAFDSSERWAVIGANDIRTQVYEPPPSVIKALVIDLQGRKPAGQDLAVGTSNNLKQDDREMSFEFSDDGNWLATGDPFSLWKLDHEKPKNLLLSGEGYPTFSADSRWLTATNANGTQLFSLSSSGAEPRGLVASYGSVHFSRDSNTLLTLENGEIRRHVLPVDKLQNKAAVYVGRNLTSNDWRSEFSNESYQKLFDRYPIEASEIDYLIRRGQQEKRDGHDDAATAFFSKATQDAIDSKNVHDCAEVVDYGIRSGVASVVLPAADYAVSVLPDDVAPRDSRGKARVSSGDLNGATSDFEFVIQKSSDIRTQRIRSAWVSRLKAGHTISTEELLRSPFDDLTLEWKPNTK